MFALRIHGLCGLILALLACSLVAQAPSSSSAPAKYAKRAARLDRCGDPLPAGAFARLGTTRWRLRGQPAVLGFGADAKTLLLFTSDGALHLLDPASGRSLLRLALPGDAGDPRSFELFSGSTDSMTGDARTAAMGSGAGVTLFDAATGKRKGHVTREEIFPPVNNQISVSNQSLQLSHDGKLLGACAQYFGEKSVVAWLNTTTGKTVHRRIMAKGHQAGPLAFTRDGKTLACVETSGGKQWLRCWNTVSGKEIRSLDLAGEPPEEIRFLPDGKALLTLSGLEAPIRVLDAITGKEIRSIRHDGVEIYGFTLSADGRLLVASSAGKAHVWDVATGRLLRTFQHEGFGESVPSLFLAPDSHTLATASQYSVVLWDVTTGKELHPTAGHVAPVWALEFSPDGRRLVSAGLDKTLRTWELPAGKEERRFRSFTKVAEEEMYPGQAGPVYARFTPDGKAILAAWSNQPAQMWETSSAHPLRHFSDGKGSYPMALSSDGKLVAAGALDGRVHVYYAGTGKKLREMVWDRLAGKDSNETPRQILAVAFARDGRTLAAAGFLRGKNSDAPHVRLWEISTSKERLRLTLQRHDDDLDKINQRSLFHGDSPPVIGSLRFSPNGKRLALGLGNAIYLWDASTGKELRQFAGLEVVAATMVFSPDGQWVTVGRLDGGIRFWRAATGELVADVVGHERAVTALAFSHDGKTLASGSDDSTVLLWDVAQLPLQGKQTVDCLSAGKWEALWAELGNSDAARAYRTVGLLAAEGQRTVSFLKPRLRPVQPADPKRVSQLLTDLDSKRYAVRNRAMRELAALGELARPALEQLLTRKPALEMRRRVETLLERMRGPVTDPAELRALRGIEVLERIGNAEARAVLQTLAGGAARHRITEEARASLVRLKRTNHSAR